MSYLEESWEQIATTLGLSTEEEMLKHLYEEQAWSISEIAKLVGYSTFIVRHRLLRSGLVMRGRGGAANRLGRRKLAHLLDDEVLKTPLSQLAERHNVNVTTAYLERQLRRKQLKLKENNDELLCDRPISDGRDVKEA